MKKMVRRLLIAGAICCGAGMVLYGSGVLFGGKEYVSAANLNRMSGTAMRNQKEDVSQMPKTQIAGVHKIEADFENIDFRIKASDDEHCYLEYTLEGDAGGVSRENPFTYEMTGDTLKLRENGAVIFADYMKIDIGAIGDIICGQEIQEYKNEVTLYVPEDQMMMGEIEMENGDFIASGIQAESLNIAMNYGDMTIEGALLKDGKLKTKDGDVEMTEVSFAGTTSVKTNFGDIEVILAEEQKGALNISSSTKYGDLHVAQDLKGKQSLSDEGGSYEKVSEHAAGTLKINTDDGDISIK